MSKEFGYALMVLLCGTMEGIVFGAYFQGCLYPIETMGALMFYALATMFFVYYWMAEATKNRWKEIKENRLNELKEIKNIKRRKNANI